MAGGGSAVHEVVPGLESECGEHPHVHPAAAASARPGVSGRYDGAAPPHAPPRYLFASAAAGLTGVAAPPQGYVRVDLETGETVSWAPGTRRFVEECVVVPVSPEHRRQDVPIESDCFVLGIMYDAEIGKSALAILDGNALADGPVALLWLEGAMPHGLHGSWRPRAGGAEGGAVLWGGV